ncbi:A disintegrin and metalloproteinase with thrombospondin motifs like [Haemaphysalis longicornis]
MVATVNIRLEETSSPQVQLAITGIERSEREKYISEYGYQISSSATLASLRNYAHWKKAHFRYPDIVFLLTGRDAYILTDGKKDTSVAGQAYLCGVCTTEYVGLAEDKPGTYSGMHTFAHEVGHLLGASHDGSGIDTKDFKRPDSRDCFYREGYLMSYVDRGPQKYHFSNCSLKQIQYTMSRAGLWCWRASYWRLINGTGEYPGMTMSLTEYCKKLFPSDYYVHVVDASTTLKKCKVHCKFMRYSPVFRHGRWASSFESYEAVRDALEYTPCKENTTKVCIQGKCLGKRARRLKLKQHDTKKE